MSCLFEQVDELQLVVQYDENADPVDDPRHQQDTESRNSGDSLIFGQTRQVQPDRGECRQQQQHADINRQQLAAVGAGAEI